MLYFNQHPLTYRLRFAKYHPCGFKALTINYIIYQFASGMIGSFGALFIYQLGGDFIHGVYFLILYFCLQRVFVFLSIKPVGKMLSTIGYRRTMLIGLVVSATKLFLLSMVTSSSFALLFVAAAMGGIHISAYFLTYHGIFLDDNDDAKVGEQIGFLTMVGRVAALISPFISGIVVTYWGFSTLFIISTILIVLSIAPVLTMQHHRHKKGVLTNLAIIDFIKKNKKVMKSSFFWYITAGIQDVFFPIYLYLVLKNYESFGFVGSLVMIFGSLAVYLSGKVYDKKQHKRMFETSTVVVSVSWFLRFFSLTSLSIVAADILNRLSSPPWWMKIRRQELLAGEKVDSLVFGAAHEYIVTFGYIFSWALAGLILLISNGNWVLLSIPVIGATLYASLLIKDA